jgi:hypothetical protein
MTKKLNSISLWWKFEGRYYHKDFYRGIKNLIKWFPVIWKDRDWDSSYIFKIMEHKLTLQSKGIGGRGIMMNSKRYAEIMSTCVRLMEKIREEYYHMEYMDYHQTDYWFEDIPDKPGFSTWESELKSENFDDYFKKYPLIHKRVVEGGEGIFPAIEEGSETEKKQRIAMNIAHINHDRARKLLFKIIESQIERWWD